MTFVSILFAMSGLAQAHMFIPDRVLCQTEDQRLLAESDQHHFAFKEPFARSTEVGRIIAFEDPDREAGESAAHVIMVADKQQFPANYLRLTVSDASFVRCLRLVPGRVRAGYVQTRESGALKLVYVEAVDEQK